MNQVNVLLITDIDNTIYNWIDFFAPSYRAMVHALSRELKISSEALNEQFREVFNKHGTLEYSYSVQELEVCNKLDKVEIDRLIHISSVAFSRARKKRLKVYPTVKEGLMWAKNNGIYIVGLTNAPIQKAYNRIRELGLIGLFDGLAGWEGKENDNILESKGEIEEVSKVGQRKIKDKKMWALKEDHLKPSTKAYEHLMSELNVLPEEVYVVGDSIEKDLLPASKLHAKCIWAKYGTIMNQKNYETLLKITYWSKQKIETTYSKKSLENMYSIEKFEEIKDIIVPNQQVLF